MLDSHRIVTPFQTGRLPDFRWPAHRRNGRYKNIGDPWVPHLKDVLRWKLGSHLGKSAKVPSTPGLLPNRPSPSAVAIPSPNANEISVTWIGHSTALVQLGGMHFLTDPIFGDCGPPWPFPRLRRSQPPGLAIQELPRVDAIILSHAHYDHLDQESLVRLGLNIPIFCPVGVGRLLRHWGFSCVTERSWGEFCDFEETRLICLPAQHGAARTPFDRDTTLWCGWLLENRGRKVYFAGDTGYASYFHELASLFAPVDLALLPIGAYRPEWFMKPLHIDPAEAVKLHLDWKAKRSVAVHWGTFRLADEPLDEPGARLGNALAAAYLPGQSFRLLDFGETLRV